MLTVLTWLWSQDQSRAVYTAEHVNIWADMVRRNLQMPHRIACVTNMPEGIDPSIEIIAPPGDFMDITSPTWTGRKPQCFRRLSMFRRDAADIFGERFVCMDLDCVITGQLDPLFDRKDDLVLFKGTSAKRPYNGSMMLIKAGCRPHVFEDFNQEMAVASGEQFCGSDQAWLGYRLGWTEKTWAEPEGVFFFSSRWRRNYARLAPRIIFFPGAMKPWTAASFDRFIKRHYRILPEREAA